VLAISGACCTTTLTAEADDAAPAQSEAEAEGGIPLSQAPEWYRPHPWYGWKTLFVDCVSLAALLGGAVAESPPVIVAGWSGYLVVSPLIHFAHGEPLNGLGSIGLRLGVPAAGGLIGAIVPYECSTLLCDLEPVVIGILIGMGTAVALDAAFLGYRRNDHAASTTPRLTPTFSIAGGRTALGVAGTF
jgi:hypothetical protein